MFGQLKKNISLNLQSALGQKVHKKIVVFESDDWGGIRMPSKEVFDHLCVKGLPIQNDPFNRFDSNASSADVTALFEVLKGHRDCQGNHPVFTFNVTTGNPDFDQIKNHHFSNFFWEPFHQTMDRSCPGALQIWKEGIVAGLMFPQYHGREHVHQQRWLQSLRNGDAQTHLAFDSGVFGIVAAHDSPEYFMAAYDYAEGRDEEIQWKSIDEGLEVFEDVFGFVPKSFIPPCYIASQSLIGYLQTKGVPALQGKMIHLLPQGIIEGKRTYKRYFRRPGLDPKSGKVNLVRNCFFEPSSKPTFDWVSNCLQRMEVAFRWGKPVIIDTHRINYIGSLVEDNRTTNLNLLNELLSKMLKKWSDIVFMNSEQLVNLYTKNNG
jgi:hypothetical protein